MFSPWQEDARTEASELVVRLEGKASREHVKVCLEAKADQTEVAEMRGRVSRWRDVTWCGVVWLGDAMRCDVV